MPKKNRKTHENKIIKLFLVISRRKRKRDLFEEIPHWQNSQFGKIVLWFFYTNNFGKKQKQKKIKKCFT